MGWWYHLRRRLNAFPRPFDLFLLALFPLPALYLRLRRRLPRVWRRRSKAERFLYDATSFFPVATIGFAVTSFFVTFAFADPIYLLAALVTGLYMSLAVQLQTNRGAAVAEATTTLPRGFAGWRVRNSTRWALPNFPGLFAAGGGR